MMVFNSFQFFLFFLVVWLCSRMLERYVKIRNVFLLLASLAFYAFFKIEFLPLLIYVVMVSYVGGLVLKKHRTRPIIATIVILSLLPLLFYKYSFFLVSNLLRLPCLNICVIPLWLRSLFLPVGISFFTLQALTYTIDIYRGKLTPVRNAVDVALAISFFPTLLSGPITRARNLLPQFKAPLTVTIETFAIGGELFIRVA